jgi:hypothetical protein
VTDEAELSPALRLAVFSRSGGVCTLCGKRIDGTREPWVPRRVTSSEPSALSLKPAHVTCPGYGQTDGGEQLPEMGSRSGDIAKISKRALPFGRKSALKRKINGRIVRRDQDP